MDILAIGNQQRIQELKSFMENKPNINCSYSSPIPASTDAQMVLDLNFDEDPTRLAELLELNKPLLLSSAKIQLAQILSKHTNASAKNQIAGCNFLPSFINRPVWELSIPAGSENNQTIEAFKKLGIEHQIVADRVGMFSPRVICMIINEAYYTLQEGTASKEDIDQGMKLGTNYPHGPFAWSQLIGLGNVYSVLDSLWKDTREERYKICPLLKTEYLNS